MKKVLILVIAALALPSVALAHGKPTNPGKSAPKVLYILKGTLSTYSKYDGTTTPPTMGSITIHVKSANYHGKALKNMDLTFMVDAKTKVNRATIKDLDKGIVKVRAPKRIAAADLATTLQTYPARQVIDQAH